MESYNKDKDILNFYKFKCGKCTVKFMDKPSLILHYKMIHGIIIKDVSIIRSGLNQAIRSIKVRR